MSTYAQIKFKFIELPPDGTIIGFTLKKNNNPVVLKPGEMGSMQATAISADGGGDVTNYRFFVYRDPNVGISTRIYSTISSYVQSISTNYSSVSNLDVTLNGIWFVASYTDFGGYSWEINNLSSINRYIEYEIVEEIQEISPIQIDNISVSEATTNKQTNVRYNFTVSNATYPFKITTPLFQKTIYSESDQWVEYNRFPEPNISDYRVQLTVEDISGSDSISLPRVDLFDFNEINTFPTTENGDVEIVIEITNSDQDGIRLNNIEYSLDNTNWYNNISNLFVYTFKNIVPGDYTVYVKDEYNRKINSSFTLTQLETPQINIKFKINGNKPPFNVELRLQEDNSLVDTKVVNIADSTNEFTDVSANTEYCLYATDAIGNTTEYCNVIYYLTADTLPYAINLGISGTLIVDEVLYGYYTYRDDDGDPESGSLFKWYRSDDASGTNKTEIIGAISQTYTLTNDDVGKYIQFSVTPSNTKGTGYEIFSEYYGAIEGKMIPVITEYVDKNANYLSWTMSDGSENSGTWRVEYSFNNIDWFVKVAGGSPRNNVLPVGNYDQTVYFRVKRISTPITEYSEVYSVYVSNVYDLTLYGAVQVVDSSASSPPPGICYTGNQYTFSNVYGDTTIPENGTALYFSVGEDPNNLYKATIDNILAHMGAFRNSIVNGIGWCRFSSISNDIWEVDPITGELIKISNWTCPL